MKSVAQNVLFAHLNILFFCIIKYFDAMLPNMLLSNISYNPAHKYWNLLYKNDMYFLISDKKLKMKLFTYKFCENCTK